MYGISLGTSLKRELLFYIRPPLAGGMGYCQTEKTFPFRSDTENILRLSAVRGELWRFQKFVPL